MNKSKFELMMQQLLAPQAPAATPVVAAPVAQAGVVPPGMQLLYDAQGNPVHVPAVAAPVVAPAPVVNPLDIYLQKPDTVPTHDAAGNPISPQVKALPTAPLLALDSTKVATAAAQIDFMQGVDQELLTKATEGDAASMMQIMQTIAGNSYAQAIQHGAALTENHVTQYGDYQATQLAPMVNTALTNQALATGTSVQGDFSHPVVQAQLKAYAAEIQLSNPTLHPAQAAEMAQQQLITMTSSVLGLDAQALTNLPQALKDASAQTVAAEVDFAAYADETPTAPATAVAPVTAALAV